MHLQPELENRRPESADGDVNIYCEVTKMNKTYMMEGRLSLIDKIVHGTIFGNPLSLVEIFFILFFSSSSFRGVVRSDVVCPARGSGRMLSIVFIMSMPTFCHVSIRPQ